MYERVIIIHGALRVASGPLRHMHLTSLLKAPCAGQPVQCRQWVRCCREVSKIKDDYWIHAGATGGLDRTNGGLLSGATQNRDAMVRHDKAKLLDEIHTLSRLSEGALCEEAESQGHARALRQRCS